MELQVRGRGGARSDELLLRARKLPTGARDRGISWPTLPTTAPRDAVVIVIAAQDVDGVGKERLGMDGWMASLPSGCADTEASQC